MKRIFILLLFIISTRLFATTYYIAQAGSNANTGLSPAQAWNTPTYASAYFLIHGHTAGDSVLLNRGDTLYGQIEDTCHGTSNAPIVWGAYGTGAKPIIWGDGRELTWTPSAYGVANVYQAYLGGYSLMQSTYYQYVSGAWMSSATWTFRGSNPTTWLGYEQGLTAGTYGLSSGRDTAYVYLYNSVSLPQSRSVFRLYRQSNYIFDNSQYTIVRDLDIRNFNIGIQVQTNSTPIGSSNIIFRNLHTIGNVAGSVYFKLVQHGLVDSCYIDSCGGSSLYIDVCDTTLVQYNIVRNVVAIIDGIPVDTVHADLCGIGIQGSDTLGFPHAWNYYKNAGWNTAQYNTCYNIYRGWSDWYFNVGDTVRWSVCHGCRSSGSPGGKNIDFEHNTTIGFPTIANGPNVVNNGNGNINIQWCVFDSIGGYGAWFSENDSAGTGGKIIYKHNYLRKSVVGTFIDYKTTTGIVSDSNAFYATSTFYQNSNPYTTLAALYTATGYEQHSVLNTAAMLSTSGDLQTNTKGFALKLPSVVTLYDLNGNSTSDAVTNAISSVPGGATGQSLSSLTAQSTTLTLGNLAGNYQVTTTNGSYAFSPITFNEYGIIGSGNSIVLISGSSQNLNVLGTLVIPVVVQVLDQYGHPVAGVTVTSTATGYPPYPNGETVFPASTISDINGYVYFLATAGRHAGTLTLAIASTGLTGSPLSATITIIRSGIKIPIYSSF